MIRTYREAVCMVTGGGSGIGEGLGRELARRGGTVILADRNAEAAARVAGEIEAGGGRATARTLDVRDAEAFEACVAEVHDAHGRLDYLFNNAGIGIGGAFEDHTLDDWRYIVDVNLMGVVHGTRAAYTRMQKQRFGHIVNTASMAGQIATPLLSSYGAIKHAVVGLSRSLRVEAADYGVRVSALCPGVIDTRILNGGGEFGRMRGPAGLAQPDATDVARAMPVDRFAPLVLDRVARNREIIVLPTSWAAIWWVDRLSRPLSGMASRWLYRRMRAEIDRRATPERRP